jgi:hypothetical protein
MPGARFIPGVRGERGSPGPPRHVNRGGEIRTLDLLVPNQARYQLRYAPESSVYQTAPAARMAEQPVRVHLGCTRDRLERSGPSLAASLFTHMLE